MVNKEDLLKLFGKSDKKILAIPIIEELAFLDENIIAYKKEMEACKPITPKTKEKYKYYHSLYKEDSNLFSQDIKVLDKMLGIKGIDKDSPIREYFRKFHGAE